MGEAPQHSASSGLPHTPSLPYFMCKALSSDVWSARSLSPPPLTSGRSVTHMHTLGGAHALSHAFPFPSVSLRCMSHDSILLWFVRNEGSATALPLSSSG